MNKDYVCQITSTSQGGFGRLEPGLSLEWSNAGIICPQCGNINQKHISEIDRVIVTVDYIPKTHSGVIGGLLYTKIFSNELFELIGPERVAQLGRIVPMENALGWKLDQFKCVLIDEQRTPGAVRHRPSTRPNELPWLCKTCGWLRYWPGGCPSKEWYVQRHDWPNGTELAHLGFLLCSSELWAQNIKPHNLKHLRGNKISILDEPLDGWPADYKELKEAVRSKGLLK